MALILDAHQRSNILDKACASRKSCATPLCLPPSDSESSHVDTSPECSPLACQANLCSQGARDQDDPGVAVSRPPSADVGESRPLDRRTDPDVVPRDASGVEQSGCDDDSIERSSSFRCLAYTPGGAASGAGAPAPELPPLPTETAAAPVQVDAATAAAFSFRPDSDSHGAGAEKVGQGAGAGAGACETVLSTEGKEQQQPVSRLIRAEGPSGLDAVSRVDPKAGAALFTKPRRLVKSVTSENEAVSRAGLPGRFVPRSPQAQRVTPPKSPAMVMVDSSIFAGSKNVVALDSTSRVKFVDWRSQMALPLKPARLEGPTQGSGGTNERSMGRRVSAPPRSLDGTLKLPKSRTGSGGGGGVQTSSKEQFQQLAVSPSTVPLRASGSRSPAGRPQMDLDSELPMASSIVRVSTFEDSLNSAKSPSKPAQGVREGQGEGERRRSIRCSLSPILIPASPKEQWSGGAAGTPGSATSLATTPETSDSTPTVAKEGKAPKARSQGSSASEQLFSQTCVSRSSSFPQTQAKAPHPAAARSPGAVVFLQEDKKVSGSRQQERSVVSTSPLRQGMRGPGASPKSSLKSPGLGPKMSPKQVRFCSTVEIFAKNG